MVDSVGKLVKFPNDRKVTLQNQGSGRLQKEIPMRNARIENDAIYQGNSTQGALPNVARKMETEARLQINEAISLLNQAQDLADQALNLSGAQLSLLENFEKAADLTDSSALAELKKGYQVINKERADLFRRVRRDESHLLEHNSLTVDLKDQRIAQIEINPIDFSQESPAPSKSDGIPALKERLREEGQALSTYKEDLRLGLSSLNTSLQSIPEALAEMYGEEALLRESQITSYDEAFNAAKDMAGLIRDQGRSAVVNDLSPAAVHSFLTS